MDIKIGDKFEKDGKLVEVVSLVPGGYSFKVLPKEELPKEPAKEAPAPVAETKEVEVKKPAIQRRKRK